MTNIFCPIAPSTPRELIAVRSWGELDGFVNWLGSADESGKREAAFADLRKTDVKLSGTDPATNLAFIEKSCGGFVRAVFRDQPWGASWTEAKGEMQPGRVVLHRLYRITGWEVFEKLLRRAAVPTTVLLELRESFVRDDALSVAPNS
ncbi:MAG: hypothetical protein ABSF50_03895 [Burkholderiaceae bacterium]|jgi:hypothetical protein